ncbi:MAG: hypothetical protein ACK2UU_23120 [Anaerolineae bacterium]|jgi:hypothetical protein
MSVTQRIADRLVISKPEQDLFGILHTNLLENGEATVHDRPIPYTVFIDCR